MYQFLVNNRSELIQRCVAKVARRASPVRPAEQPANGVPLFLEQIIQTLRAEGAEEDGESLRISGSSSGGTNEKSVMATSAAAHANVLLDAGFSIEEVVHDYGDLCQAITDLAVERDAPFSMDQFRTLNRCLDNTIAGAVAEFSRQRDARIERQFVVDENQRLGIVVHELRNHLHIAMLGFSALEAGKVGISGSTAGIVRRSLASLSMLLDETIAEVRLNATPENLAPFSVALFLVEIQVTASMYAGATGSRLVVPAVDPDLAIAGNRILLAAALVNLLQNAFKFTQSGTEVVLTARGEGDRVLIEVQDHCGGLSEGAEQRMFKPFSQVGSDKRGLGLGLTIARRNVQADGGALCVKNRPGSGCVFTIDLPRRALQSTAGKASSL